MKQNAFTLMELMIVIVIIGILAAVGLILFSDFSLKAKKTVAAKNYRQIINFIQTESALCEFNESNKIFGNNSCPITDSVPGAQSGWCGIFGNYFLKKAKIIYEIIFKIEFKTCKEMCCIIKSC